MGPSRLMRPWTLSPTWVRLGRLVAPWAWLRIAYRVVDRVTFWLWWECAWTAEEALYQLDFPGVRRKWDGDG